MARLVKGVDCTDGSGILQLVWSGIDEGAKIG